MFFVKLERKIYFFDIAIWYTYTECIHFICLIWFATVTKWYNQKTPNAGYFPLVRSVARDRCHPLSPGSWGSLLFTLLIPPPFPSQCASLPYTVLKYHLHIIRFLSTTPKSLFKSMKSCWWCILSSCSWHLQLCKYLVYFLTNKKIKFSVI